MQVLVILAIVGFVAAVSSLLLSVVQTIGVLLAGFVLVGIYAFHVSPNLFDFFWMVVGFGAPAIIGAAALGVVVGLCLRKRRYVLAVLFASPFPLFLYQSHSGKEQERAELAMALEYVTHHRQLDQLIGGPVSASLYTYPGNIRSKRGRYEYTLKGKNPGDWNVIVEVARKSAGPEFKLLCVTTLSLGKRDASKDACEQSVVPLPE